MSEKEFNKLKKMELANFMGEARILTKFGDVHTLYLRDASKQFTEIQLEEVVDILLDAFRVWNHPIVIDFTTQPPY